jgi:hypothetical protein
MLSPMPSDPDRIPPRSNGKHPGGQPAKRTPERVKKIAEAIAQGLPDEFAAAVGGITRETLYQWRNDPAFQEYSYTIKAAIGERLLKRLSIVDKGLPGWQGAAWMIERIHAKHFCRPEIQLNQQFNVNVAAPTFSQVRVIQLGDTEFNKLLDKPNYVLLPDGTLERNEGSLKLIVGRSSLSPQLPEHGT